MREYFNHAYKGFCNSMEQFANLAENIAEVAKVIFVYITLPVWIIPYSLWVRKENERDRRTIPEE